MRRRSLWWPLAAILAVAIAGISTTFALGVTPLLGLDLKGGVSVVEQPQGNVNSSILQQAVEIISRRVDGLGVANAEVARQGSDVVINLPGIKDSQKALSELGQTAQLFYRPVYCLLPPQTKSTKATPSTTVPPGKSPTSTTVKAPSSTTVAPAGSTTLKPTSSTTAKVGAPPAVNIDAKLAAAVTPVGDSLQAASTPAGSTPASTQTSTPSSVGSSASAGSTASNPLQELCNSRSITSAQLASLPTTPVSQDVASNPVILPNLDNTVRYALGPAEMTGSVVSKAAANYNVQNSPAQWEVDVTFTKSGATEFDKYAAQHYACYQQSKTNPPPCALQAIDLDGVVESAPAIEAASFNGGATISGSQPPMTQDQANSLALALNYGSLPVRFVPQSIQYVSATIGKDSLKAGLIAGIVAIILVLGYLIIYYRALGFVVILGLCTSGALLYSLVTLLSQTAGLTLTLSGVIGIIVSVGVTADSYVVYFERLKDEVRAGRTVRQSVERGFSRAYRTILTADFSSLTAALILYWLTVGSVRGFAFFLGLSTLLDMVTAYMFTRPLVILLGRRRAFTEARFFGISKGLGAKALMS